MRYLATVFIAVYLLIAPVFAGSLFETEQSGKSKNRELFLESGTDVHHRGQQSETVLHWMAFDGNEAMVEKLINSGADINAQLHTGSTPLHLAAYKGHINVTRLLVARSARVNIRTRDGITPLDWALRNGKQEVAELLIINGAKSGRLQAGSAIGMRRSEQRLEDLKLSPHVKRLLARHRFESGHPTNLSKWQSSKVHVLDSQLQAGAFRIQLAALGTHERALDAWNRFCSQHPGILGDSDLYVEFAHVKGKAFYRVQTGSLSKRDAGALCNQLRQRNQPCVVVNSAPLFLAEQGKLKRP